MKRLLLPTAVLLTFVLFVLSSRTALCDTVLATDTFTRANDGNLGANWTEQGGGFGFKVLTNAAAPDDISSNCIAVYDGGVSWAVNQYVQAKITVTGTGGGGNGQGVAARGDTVADTYYAVNLDHAASNNVTVGRYVTGAFTSLGTRTTTWVDGDLLKLVVTGTGAGIVLKVYQNGSQLGADIADVSGGIDSAGKPGLSYSSTSTSASADDWEAGTVVSAFPQHYYRMMRENQ